MPVIEMTIPSPGEAILEVEIVTLLVEDGDYVEKDQAIAEIDSDKATLELPAEESGIIHFRVQEGDEIAVGAVVCTIDAIGPEDKKEEKEGEKKDEGNIKSDADFRRFIEDKKKKEVKKKEKKASGRVVVDKNEEYFPYKIGDKVVQLAINGWSFDKKGLPHRTPDEDGNVDLSQLEPYMEITGIGNTMFFFVAGHNEHVDSKANSWQLAKYNPKAKSINDYSKWESHS